MKVEGEGGRGNSAAGDLLQSGAAVSVRGAAACAEVNFVKLVIVAAHTTSIWATKGEEREKEEWIREGKVKGRMW